MSISGIKGFSYAQNWISGIFALLICLNANLHGQIVIEDNFENGRLDTAYQDSSAYVLWPITNLHARVSGTLNQQPTFKVYDSLGYQLRPYHHMVYRYEGDSAWHFFDTAWKNLNMDYYHFQNQTPFTGDSVYLAYWYPYTYSDLEYYLDKIDSNQYLLNKGIKGMSPEGRNLYGYEITDTSYAECYKANIVITARQHPVENINGYFVEGFTDYLLYGSDSIADFLRKNYHFFIYPMLNPDGVFNGSGQNSLGQGLNREWEDSLQPGGTPEIDTIRPVIWQETGQKVDWSIDIHSNPGSNIPYYWWGYNGASPVPQWQKDRALEYVQAVAVFDSSSPNNGSSYQNYIQGNGVSNSKTAANWFRKSFDAIAFTFEPTSEPMGPTGDNAYSINQLKRAGKSLAMGFYEVFDSTEALGGMIISTPNYLTAEINGGAPPLNWTWTGPVNSNADTLFSPPSGLYTLQVEDSAGCQWESQILHSPLSTTFSFSPPFILYPNPAKSYLDLSWEGKSGLATLEWIDFQGKLQYRTKLILAKQNRISLPSALKGIYVLRIQTKEGIYLQKVIVE